MSFILAKKVTLAFCKLKKGHCTRVRTVDCQEKCPVYGTWPLTGPGVEVERAATEVWCSSDSYELRVTQAAYARLLAEAKRTAPANVSPYKHAWQTSLMAAFEAGLIPHVRLEHTREDPSLTYQASRTRAKKHETDALRVTPTPSPTTHASAVTGTYPGPERQLITSMANIEKAIVSKLTAVRGQGKSVTFEPAAYRPSDKQGRSPSGDAREK